MNIFHLDDYNTILNSKDDIIFIYSIEKLQGKKRIIPQWYVYGKTENSKINVVPNSKKICFDSMDQVKDYITKTFKDSIDLSFTNLYCYNAKKCIVEMDGIGPF